MFWMLCSIIIKQSYLEKTFIITKTLERNYQRIKCFKCHHPQTNIEMSKTNKMAFICKKSHLKLFLKIIKLIINLSINLIHLIIINWMLIIMFMFYLKFVIMLQTIAIEKSILLSSQSDVWVTGSGGMIAKFLSRKKYFQMKIVGLEIDDSTDILGRS